MRYKITAPLKGFTGQSVGVVFKDGVAEIDDTTDGGRSALAYFQRASYRVDPTRDDEPAAPDPAVGGDEPFDPSDHKADEVLSHLGTASYEEAVRVLDAEAAGKDRVTVTGKRDEILTGKAPTTPAAAGDDQKGPQA